MIAILRLQLLEACVAQDHLANGDIHNAHINE